MLRLAPSQTTHLSTNTERSEGISGGEGLRRLEGRSHIGAIRVRVDRHVWHRRVSGELIEPPYTRPMEAADPLGHVEFAVIDGSIAAGFALAKPRTGCRA